MMLRMTLCISVYRSPCSAIHQAIKKVAPSKHVFMGCSSTILVRYVVDIVIYCMARTLGKKKVPLGHPYDYTRFPYKQQIWDLKQPNKLWLHADKMCPFRYYVIGGASPQEVLNHYTYLSGRHPLPPIWYPPCSAFLAIMWNCGVVCMNTNISA